MTKHVFKTIGLLYPGPLIASAWARLKGVRGVNVVAGKEIQRAGVRQRSMTRALAFSLIFHTALIGGVFFWVGQKPPFHDRVIRISLVEDLPGGNAAGKTGRQGKEIAVPGAAKGASKGVARKVKDALAPPRPVPVPSRQSAPVDKAVSEKPIISREPAPVAYAAPPVPAVDPAASDAGNASGRDYAAKGDGLGVGAGGGSRYGSGSGFGGTGAGAGPGGSGAGSGQAAYLREHFVYIRDLIMKNLKYPEVARKLGWKGAVTVSFVVLESGVVHNIRVVKSSGHDILDKAVVKTIHETQPFPKPPVKAELTIPIVFRLEAGTG